MVADARFERGRGFRFRLLAKNAVFNFVGQTVPSMVNLFTIPYLVRALGANRYGVLSLVWVLLGYFVMLDAGVGRATARFVAEAFGRDEIHRVRPVVWASALAVCVLGVAGGVVLALITPFLVTHLLNVPAQLRTEAQYAFWIASASIVVTLVGETLRGTLEAHQRFDLINAVKIPSDILASVLPVVALWGFHASLGAIVALVLADRTFLVAAYSVLVMRVAPATHERVTRGLKSVPALFHYGWWLALTEMILAVFLTLDRFIIGALLTMSAVTYYTIPYSVANKVLVIPASIMPVLFPAFSSLNAVEAPDLRLLLGRAAKYLAILMGLLVAGLIVFARDILLFWLGPAFLKSTFVLQVMAVGVLISAFAWLGTTMLQAIGDVKVVALIYLVQLPVYVVSAWAFIRWDGIDGAALSWSLRILVSFVLLSLVSVRRGFSLSTLFAGGQTVRLWGALIVVSVVALLIESVVPTSVAIAVVMLCVFVFVLGSIIWRYVFDGYDRSFVQLVAQRVLSNKGKIDITEA